VKRYLRHAEFTRGGVNRQIQRIEVACDDGAWMGWFAPANKATTGGGLILCASLTLMRAAEQPSRSQRAADHS
jgi:hypothetical protein